MKIFTLFLLLLLALVAAGCGRADKPVEMAGSQTSNNSSQQPKSAETASTNDFQTGVAACDDYLTRVETCLKKPNIPEAVRASYRQSLEQNRAAWKQAASTAQGKQQLESSCKTAMEAAKPFFDSCK